MSPINPSAPPPALKERATIAVRAAAHKNRKSLTVAAMGVGVFLLITISTTFAMGFMAAMWFLFGASIQYLVTGAK